MTGLLHLSLHVIHISAFRSSSAIWPRREIRRMYNSPIMAATRPEVSPFMCSFVVTVNDNQEASLWWVVVFPMSNRNAPFTTRIWGD